MQRDGSRRRAGGPSLPIGAVRLASRLNRFCASSCASWQQAAPRSPDAGAVGAGARRLQHRVRIDRRPAAGHFPEAGPRLNEEAAALRIAVAPAGGEASYRLRGYLAAHPEGSTTSIAWAWDVYDAELHRAFRLSGEERAGANGGRTVGRRPMSAAASDRPYRDGAACRICGGWARPVAPAPPAAERSGPAVASRDTVAAPDPVPAPHRRSALVD